MFAIPTVVAAFEPLWVAILVGIAIFGFSVWLLKESWGNRHSSAKKVELKV
jgi:hypothetical protein